MQSYEIPRNYRGEGRILYIFSTKGLIFTCGGAAIGLIFFFIFRILGKTMIGIIITAIFAAIGFCIGTFKIPDIKKWDFATKNSGENIDDVIVRWIKFKKNGRKIYIYTEPKIEEETEEETKDGQQSIN